MTQRASSRLAWGGLALSAALTSFSLILFGPGPADQTFASTWLNWVSGIFTILVFLAFPAIGALIVSRLPGNSIGWILVAIGACLAIVVAVQSYASQDPSSAGAQWTSWISGWAAVAGFGLVPFVLLLFPDGRLLSRRWCVIAWLTALAVALLAVSGSFIPGPLMDTDAHNPIGAEALRAELQLTAQIGWVLFEFCLIACAVSMIVRFRRSAGERRLQMKWFAFSASVFALGFLSQDLFYGDEGLSALGGLVLMLAFLALPLGMGAAILRYRLYDIDLIINRTLVYGSLTAVLGLIYFGLVVIFQRAMQPLTAQSDLAVAISTLLVAALFRPARRRIQSFIDRRFYRAKYDASKTLEAFAARQREVVNLDALQGELLGVVSQTMQPVHASVWLRSREGSAS